jgi:hypothetical protein
MEGRRQKPLGRTEKWKNYEETRKTLAKDRLMEGLTASLLHRTAAAVQSFSTALEGSAAHAKCAREIDFVSSKT